VALCGSVAQLEVGGDTAPAAEGWALGSEIASPAWSLCERFRKKRGGDVLTGRRRRNRTNP
jgi:hypothetical protein